METNKKIKMLMFGRPKTGKTKNVLETYPTPILLLNFEPGGYDCVEGRKIEVWDRAKLISMVKDKPAINCDIVVRDLFSSTNKIGTSQFKDIDPNPMQEFMQAFNSLFYEGMPFKTLVVDGWTDIDSALCEFLIHWDNPKVKVMNENLYGMANRKKEEICNCLISIPTNVVVIAHELVKEDDVTKEMKTVPSGDGKFQLTMGKFFSQVVQAFVETGTDGKAKYRLRTTQKGIVQDVGCRWPHNLPPVVDNNYNAIFGGNK